MEKQWRTTRMVDWLINPERNGELVILYQEPKADKGYADSYQSRSGLYYSRLSQIFYRIRGYLITEVPVEDLMTLIDESVSHR